MLGIAKAHAQDDSEIATPTIEIQPHASEVHEGEDLVLTLTRSGSTAEELSLELYWQVRNSSTTEVVSVDYFLFSSGDATKTISIPTVTGQYGIDGQLFEVEILDNNSEYLVLATASFTVIDRPVPVVQLQAHASEVVEGEPLALTLARSEDTSLFLGLDPQVTIGTNAAKSEYGFISFEPESTTAELHISTKAGAYGNDGQPVEVDFLYYGPGDYQSVVVATASFTVIDRPVPVIQLQAHASEVVEGEPLALTLARSEDTSWFLELGYQVKSGTNAVIYEYGYISFEPESTTAELHISTKAGAYGNDGQPVEVDFLYYGPGDYQSVVVATASFTVIDRPVPVIQLQAHASEVVEGEPLALTLARSEDTSWFLELGYQVKSGTNAVIYEYGYISFEPESTTAELHISTKAGAYGNDGQPVEVDFLYYGPGDYEPVVVATTSFTVIERPVPAIQILPYPLEVTEGESIEFQLVQTGDLSEIPAVQGYDVTYQVTSGEIGIHPASGAVSFAPGSANAAPLELGTLVSDWGDAGLPVEVKFFYVFPAEGDSEDPLSVEIATASLTLVDAPPLEVEFQAAPYLVTEGNEITITALRKGDLANDLVLGYNVTSGGAGINGVGGIVPDQRSGSITFEESANEATVTLDTLPGVYGEEGHLVTVEIFGLGGSIGSKSVKIIDLVITVSNPAEVNEGWPVSLVLTRSGALTNELVLGYNGIGPVQGNGSVTFGETVRETTLELYTLFGDYGESGQSANVFFFSEFAGAGINSAIANAGFLVLETGDPGPEPLPFIHETPISFDSNQGSFETLVLSPPLLNGGYRIEFSMQVGTHVPVYLPVLTRGVKDASDIEIYLQPQNGFANLAVVHNRGNGGPLDLLPMSSRTLRCRPVIPATTACL